MASINAKDHSGAAAAEFYKPKKGELCLAQFSADKTWYRAQIQGWDEKGENAFVLYVDYGNAERVPKANLRPIAEPAWTAMPFHAHECFLCFVNPPTIDDEWGYEAAECFRELVWDKADLVACILRRDGNKLHVKLGDPSTKTLFSSTLVRKGYALAQHGNHPDLTTIKADEEFARRSRAGMWVHGDFRE